MKIAASATMGHPAGGQSVRSSWLVLLALMVGVSLGADPYRPAPKFTGKGIPKPPSQLEPWTAPATKLPKFLVTATGLLFDQGVADPRGCEYRQVEIGNGSIIKARGFVLPEQADTPGRFVICWDGQVYPALTVGDPADLDRDINEIIANFQRGREAGTSNEFSRGVSWALAGEGQGQNYYGRAGVDDHSPLKLCLLLRLGRVDLAEALFAAGTLWTAEPRTRDLTDYHINYLTLAFDWALGGYRRLIQAHVQGNDVIALDTARNLTRFRDLATAKADAMGFARPDRQDRFGPGPAPRFYFLTQLDELLNDHEVRAKMPPRGPIPKKGGDPAARVAALIRDLDQIDERQMGSPGAAHPESSPLVKDLIAEGDSAVEPLLVLLESDNRLTRSVDMDRGGSIERYVHTVREVAFSAVIRILKTREFENQGFSRWKKDDPASRKALASSIRQLWEKTRSIPLIERWYGTLLDDSAGSTRWLQVAGSIVAPVVVEGMPFPKPGTRPMRGEELRTKQDPSITDLILRRARQLERMDDPEMLGGQGFAGACHMGSVLATWDEKASLPLVKDLMKGCLVRSNLWRNQENRSSDPGDLASYLTRFTLVRVKLGDLEALDEYAVWLRTMTPKLLGSRTVAAFQPLLEHPDHPALVSAADWLFTDSKSPWVPLLPEARGEQASPFQNLMTSQLIVIAGFREGLIAGLADKTPLGTIEKTDKTSLQRKIKNNGTTGSTHFNLDGVAIGVETPFRRCDYLASLLSGLEGSPRCELYWPEPRRDEAVIACVAFLKRFGALFAIEASPGIHEYSNREVRLRFPTLAKPASLEDVAAARAIFSLEGQGEARQASMPGFPRKARWTTLEKGLGEPTDPDSIFRRELDSEGYVWQAEEVRKGDAWERFYGFVGHHVIARVPASEIEFVSGFTRNRRLEARTELVNRASRYELGQPILVTMQLRNMSGVSSSSPTEFLRPGPDGKPALRKGVTLSLSRPPSRELTLSRNQFVPNELIKPKRDAHFDPNKESRPLTPLEAFEAMRLDLADWFDLTKPGKYHIGVNFTADSGIGEGSSSEASFQVGDEE